MVGVAHCRNLHRQSEGFSMDDMVEVGLVSADF